MSRYGTLKTWAAGQLGLKDAVSLLDETGRKRDRRSPE
jgi:ferritin-like metal-binding protein YciE